MSFLGLARDVLEVARIGGVTIKIAKTLILTLVTLGGASTGCDRNRSDDEAITDREAVPLAETRADTPGNEPSTNEDTAIPGAQAQAGADIAKARCEMESRCGNVGLDKDYASEGACRAKFQEDLADDLNFKDCPGGIVQKELSECLQEIRGEECDSPLDALSRIAACRESDLCKAI